MRRLLLVLILCFSLASLLIYLLGDSGLLAYAKLSRYHQTLMANVKNLQQRNAELQAELAGLQNLPEQTVVLARSIDLYAPGERVVQVEGLPSPRQFLPVGDRVFYDPPTETRSADLKAGALVLGLLLFFGLPLARRWVRRKEHGT